MKLMWHGVVKRSQHRIVNTCGFIDKAKEESINTILDQVELKRRGKLDKVIVTGCLSERYKNNLEAEIPEVDAFYGTMELPMFLKQFEADYKTELVGERLLSTPSHYAYLKISEGCKSAPVRFVLFLNAGQHVLCMDDLVKEAEGPVKKGKRNYVIARN
jgi:ribosomal protein S12 methylthiotransferase